MTHTFSHFRKLPLDLRVKIYKYVSVRDILLHKDVSYYDHILWGRTIILAGILNDIEALELASMQGEQQREMICPILAFVGNWKALKWARRVDKEDDDDTKVVIKEKCSNIDNNSIPLPWDWKTCAYAAAGGHLRIVQWLYEMKCPWNQETSEYAAARGDLTMLRWLHQHHCPWGDYTYSMAAANGHFDLVQWLYEKNCPWNEGTCAYAAAGGNLHILQWLYEKHCPWNEDTCCTAIAYGHYDVFQWAKSHGCPVPYGL